MQWRQITFDVPDFLKDAVMGELSEHGAAGVWESDQPDSGQTHVVAYFDQSHDDSHIEHAIGSLFGRMNLAAPAISHGSVEERDWTEEWKKSYTTFPIGHAFFVIPSWCDSLCPEDRLPIRIDPGQAFGTGTHETTQLTMEALERWVEPDQVVLDLGTGSGILAIAARLLGARRVFACEIDPVAAQVAYANIGRNVEGGVSTFCGSIDAVRPGVVDLLLCNLTADLIVHLFSDIDRAIRPDGCAIFSGILTEQREALYEGIRRFGYTIHEEMTRGEWFAFVTQKSARNHGA